MVVTLGAAEGGSQPGGGDGSDALGAVLGEVLGRLGTTLTGHHVEAVVAGGDARLGSGVREEVARELLAREGVEGLIRIERSDDVVAVGEDALVLVAVEADGIGEAGDI